MRRSELLSNVQLTREFTFNLMLLFLINLLIKPIYIFAIDAEVQNRLGTEQYGWYFHVFNVIFLLSVVNDPGIQNWNAQYLPRHRMSAASHLSSVVGVKMLLAFVFMCFTWCVMQLAGYGHSWLFLMLSGNLVLSSAFMILRGSIAGLGHYRTDSWLSSLDKVLMAFILGVLLYSNSIETFTLQHFVYGQAIATLLACAVGFILLRSKVDFSRPEFSWQSTSKVLRNSAPYLLILLFMTAYNRMDGILLGFLLHDNNHAAGIYAGAYRLYDAANMTGYLFASVLLPMYAAHNDQKELLSGLVNAGARYSSIVAGIALISVWFYGDEILHLLYDVADEDMQSSLRWLMAAYFCTALGYIFGTLVVSSGDVGRLNFVFGAGLLVNVLLHLLLIPAFGATGAALTTFLTQALVLFAQVWLVRHQFSVSLDKKMLLHILVFLVGSVLIFAVSEATGIFQWWFRWLLNLIICVLLSFALQLVEWEDVKFFLHKRRAGTRENKQVNDE